MPAGTIAIDLVALLIGLTGYALAFRQDQVRRWLNGLKGRSPVQGEPIVKPEDDPARHAMLIFGTMILAFGILLFGFATVYALA